VTKPMRSSAKPSQPTAVGKANQFPNIIAAWPSGRKGEVLQVALDRFKNSFTIEIRCWEPDANGGLRRGRNGATLSVRHLPKLTEVLVQARERAELWGLVPAANSKDRTMTEP
jgi:hypothetical protein